jgi:hypothetical protein
MTHLNDSPVNDEPNTAFGGVKASGIGRFGGEWTIREFTTEHWVSVQRAALVPYLSRLKWARVSQRGQLDVGTGVATDEAGAGEDVGGGWLEVCLAVDVGVWPGDG